MYYGSTQAYREQYISYTWSFAYAQTAGAQALYPKGCDLIFKFLADIGQPQTIDFKHMNNNWEFAYENRKNDINATLAAAEALAVSGKSITFYTKNEIKKIAPDNLPMHDYKLAINSYYSKVKCTVTKLSSIQYRATINYGLEDIFDWDPAKTKVEVLVSQSDLWELHHAGWAQQFKVSGMNTMQITWTVGQRYPNVQQFLDIS